MRNVVLPLILTLLACDQRVDTSVPPLPAGLPSEFPPAAQLVDERTLPDLASAAIGAPAVAPPSETQSPAPQPQPFSVRADAGTLMYPHTLWPDATIAVYAVEPVAGAALSEAIELVGATSKEDLVAGRVRTIPFTLEDGSPTPKPITEATGIVFSLRPNEPFQTGHWYRVRIAAGLSSVAGAKLANNEDAYARGPEPLQVTGVACGWPACTIENRWTVSFNGPVDAASLASCMRTKPTLELGAIAVEGWSATFMPTAPKVGTTYKLTLDERCKSTTGDRLVAPYEASVRVEAPRARLSLPRGTGYITPTKDISIKVGAAHTGRLTIGTTRITRAALPEFLAANRETWGGLNFNKATVERTTTVDPVGEGDVEVRIPLAKQLREGRAAAALAMEMGGDRGLVYVRVEAQHIGADDEPPVRQALVQVTELGLSAKFGPEDTLVWVTSLVDQTPQAGVTIDGIDAAGKKLWTATTDERGIATGLGRKESGGADTTEIIIASRGQDTAFLDLAEYNNRTEAYEFGITRDWDAQANALRGILFTERGVYRSGETVHVKGYVRVERGGKLERVVGNARVTISNPLGDRALQRDLDIGPAGDFEVDLPLSETAALGTWGIEMTTPSKDGQAVANGSVRGGFRVEAYRPNSFEVKVDDLTRSGDRLHANAIGRYYYGAPMVDANARWWVTREEAGFSPAGYEGFTFQTPRWADDAWEPHDSSVMTISEGTGTLDAEGHLAIEADLAALAKSLENGPQRLMLEVQVDDVDAQAVTNRATTRIESADHYLGVRASTTFAGHGENVDVDVVAVTPDGQVVPNAAVTVRWIERDWVTRRVPAAGGGMTWESERHDRTLAERHLQSAVMPVRTTFVTGGGGLYWIEVEGKDAKGRVMRARESVWVWGDGASWREDDRGHIQLIAAKSSWKLGETARFVVQSPFETTQALLTVEANGIIWRDSRVLTGSAPLVEIPVTEAMMPNAFLSVVLIGKPKGSDSAEVRIGYTTIGVDTDDRRLDVTVTPDQARHRPGETVTVRVAVHDKAGNPRPAHVTFMAVDEGVLSLTGYHTPDPHEAFYKERALAISTSESRRSMWSGLSADDGMKSDWGGGGEGGEATNYRAAFATTAAFMPDVVVGTGGEAEVSFKLPDNLTTFRLMAVAVSEDGAFGNGQADLEVSKPLLVRPGLPRFLSVGDRFDARAIVQALEAEYAGEVDVELAVSGPIVIEGASTQRISASAKATPVTFVARATEPGVATFAFKLQGKGAVGAVSPSAASDAVEVSIPVTWPAAKRSASSSGVVAATSKREATTLKIPEWVRDDVGGVTVTLTSTRLGELLPGLDYLLKYPYGCVEQTTGGTLPLLAMADLQSGFELPGMSKDEVKVRAQAGIDRLRTMQTWSGGLAYWPGETAPHPWGSVYAGMALVRASKQGLDVPASVIERLSNYLRDVLRDQAASAQEEWHSELLVVKPFAAYVLALAGTPEPSFNAALYATHDKLPDFGKLLLALAITESHGERALAEKLIDEVVANVRVDGERVTIIREEGHYWHSTLDSDVRSLALLAMALQAVRPDDALLAQVQKGLLEARRGGRWESTQENAFAVLALAKTFLASERPDAKFTAKVELDGQVWLDATMTGSDAGAKTVTLPMYLARKAHGKELVITREGDSAPMYFSLTFDYTPKEVPTKAVMRGFGIERRYRIADGPRKGQVIDAAHASQVVQAGDTVQVDLLIEAPEVRRYVAIDDPLPAGLEPLTLDFATARATAETLPEPDERWRVGGEWVFNHSEQRDDRVVLFSDRMPAGRHRYTYLARATTEGAFMAPAARVHEMYHPDVFAQTPASALIINEGAP